jgi:hypothetical protein
MIKFLIKLLNLSYFESCLKNKKRVVKFQQEIPFLFKKW